MVHRPLNVVVLGAGPAGLATAWNLVQDGHRVLVLEKERVWGGQSLTFADGDFRFDLGPHNIHSRHLSVIDFIEQRLNTSWFERRPRAEIFFQGQRIEYPLVGTQVLRFLPKGTAVLCGLSFLWRRLASFFSPGFADDGTYETWVINRFGKRFYDIFFGPYTFKTWGIPPRELSDIVAKKRIAVRGMIELVKSIFFTSEAHHVEDPRKGRHGYLKHGIGEITDFFAREITGFGGEIQTQACLKTLRLEQGRISAISYVVAGEEKTIEFGPSGGENEWEVISTVPLNDLIGAIDGPLPEETRRAAGGLDFTSEVFLYLKYADENVFQVPLLYFSDAEFPFTRIYDVGMFSRDMVPRGKNAVCLELTCREGDATWTMSEADVFEKCVSSLERRGLVCRDKIEGYAVRRLRHAYPLFRVGTHQRLKEIFGFLHSVPNLLTLGRQGLFAYANVDDVIWMGFEIAKSLPYQKRMRLRLEELLPEYVEV